MPENKRFSDTNKTETNKYITFIKIFYTVNSAYKTSLFTYA